MHSGDDPIEFVLPGLPWAGSYQVVIDTTQPAGGDATAPPVDAGKAIIVDSRSVLLLRIDRAAPSDR
jgi:glycogen operon protein